VALTTPNSFGGSPDGSRALVLISRSTMRGVSIRRYDAGFIQAVARAMMGENATVPFFVVLDDPASRDGDQRPQLYFTATIATDKRASARTFTDFRLDSVVPSTAGRP
jgi:hypothetical protein